MTSVQAGWCVVVAIAAVICAVILPIMFFVHEFTYEERVRAAVIQCAPHQGVQTLNVRDRYAVCRDGTLLPLLPRVVDP